MNVVKAVNDWLCKIENIFNSIALVVVLVVISAQIICRYVFTSPLIWSEELSRYLYVWIAWIGCAFCTGTRSNITVPVIFDNLPQKAKCVLTVAGNLIILVMFGYLLYCSAQYAVSQLAFMASTMQISRFWMFAALPLGIGLTMVQLVLDTVLFVAENRKGDLEK